LTTYPDPVRITCTNAQRRLGMRSIFVAAVALMLPAAAQAQEHRRRMAGRSTR